MIRNLHGVGEFADTFAVDIECDTFWPPSDRDRRPNAILDRLSKPGVASVHVVGSDQFPSVSAGDAHTHQRGGSPWGA